MGDTAVDTMARKGEKLFLNPKLILKPKPTTDTVDTAVDMDMVDMAVDTVDTVVDSMARDLLNLILSLKLKPTMVDTMVAMDTDVDTVTVDTADMVTVDSMDKCHLSSQI